MCSFALVILPFELTSQVGSGTSIDVSFSIFVPVIVSSLFYYLSGKLPYFNRDINRQTKLYHAL